VPAASKLRERAPFFVPAQAVAASAVAPQTLDIAAAIVAISILPTIQVGARRSGPWGRRGCVATANRLAIAPVCVLASRVRNHAPFTSLIMIGVTTILAGTLVLKA